jgi:hypothetical protein
MQHAHDGFFMGKPASHSISAIDPLPPKASDRSRVPESLVALLKREYPLRDTGIPDPRIV